MKSNRIEGKVTSINDNYAIVEFAKGAISFEEKGYLYTNMHKFSIFVGSDGKIGEVTKMHDMIVRYDDFERIEVRKYMLASLLSWSDYALKNYIYKILGNFI